MTFVPKSFSLQVLASGLMIGLVVAEPAFAQVQSTVPILHSGSAVGGQPVLGVQRHSGAGIGRRAFSAGVGQPGLGVGGYQPYYHRHLHVGNYGHYPLTKFDYPSIVPQYSH